MPRIALYCNAQTYNQPYIIIINHILEASFCYLRNRGQSLLSDNEWQKGIGSPIRIQKYLVLGIKLDQIVISLSLDSKMRNNLLLPVVLILLLIVAVIGPIEGCGAPTAPCIPFPFVKSTCCSGSCWWFR